MTNRLTTGLCVFAALLGQTARTAAGDDRPTAKTELARIAAALPEGFKKADLPTDDPKKDLARWTGLRSARMTSPTTAKITISVYGPKWESGDGEAVLRKDWEMATAALYLSWYDGRWTVDRHEPSSWFTANQGYTDHLLSLAAFIEEVPLPGFWSRLGQRVKDEAVARRLAAIRHGMTSKEVEAILGKPAGLTLYHDPIPARVVHYGIVSVEFDRNDQAVRIRHAEPEQ